MKNVYAILNLHNGPHLGALTEGHPLGSISFLGRYGIMDFALSNISNSGIDRIAILVESHSHSIRSHIQGGRIWINNTKTGDLGEYINENALSTPKFNTDISNIRESLSPIDKQIIEDYVLVVPPHFVMSMDYRPVVEQHIASGADITIVSSRRKDADKEFSYSNILTIDEDNRVTDIEVNEGKKAEADVSLEAYVINKKTLIDIVTEAETISSLFSIKDMIRFMVKFSRGKICAYRYEGMVLPITSLENYVNFSFKCLEADVAYSLFKKDWPIYTTTHNTPPARYGETADVSNSVISNGCVIDGKVENSIISRNVIIEKGAVVKNSIIFTSTTIKSGVKVSYVLAGKHVHMEVKKEVSGNPDQVLFIDYGEKI